MNKFNQPHQLASSLSLEEWLDAPDARPTQNWLLTYIDVFVLVVMLVVTLVSLSRFDTEKPSKSHANPAQGQVKPDRKSKLKAEAGKEKLPVKKDVLKPNSVKAPLHPPVVAKPEATNAPSAKPPRQKPVVENKNTKAGKSESKQVAQPKRPKQPHKKPAPVKTQSEIIRQQLQQQLKTLGLQDKIQMTVAKGYAQLKIQDNILYQSSDAQLSDSGKAVLKRLTPLLQQSKGVIYIEGHTDNRPIKTTQFPSNWELGAARATSVLHFLAEQHIDPTRMRAVTFADTKPIADNATEEGRQKNRRVNIVIKVADER